MNVLRPSRKWNYELFLQDRKRKSVSYFTLWIWYTTESIAYEYLCQWFGRGKKLQFAFFCSINIFNQRFMFGNFIAHAQCTVPIQKKRMTSFCIIFTPSHQKKSPYATHTVSLNIEYVKHLRPFSTPRFYPQLISIIVCSFLSLSLNFAVSAFVLTTYKVI